MWKCLSPGKTRKVVKSQEPYRLSKTKIFFPTLEHLPPFIEAWNIMIYRMLTLGSFWIWVSTLRKGGVCYVTSSNDSYGDLPFHLHEKVASSLPGGYRNEWKFATILQVCHNNSRKFLAQMWLCRCGAEASGLQPSQIFFFFLEKVN